MDDNTILKVKDLSINFETKHGVVRAVDEISFDIEKGQVFALVGESGCGKSTTALGIMRLLQEPGKIAGGNIIFEGRDLAGLDEKDMTQVRGKEIGMIFQNPLDSLNPVYSIGYQVSEGLIEGGMSKEEAYEKAFSTLKDVKISDVKSRMKSYPHEISGGMRQRVMIAMMLCRNPKLLIADEPTTALDVTIQAQVLEMIYKLKSENNTSMILITHDLGVVAQNCDYVAIIYAGEVVEYGTLREIYKDTKHPYTEGLFGSIPSLTSDVKRLQAIDGMMPDPTKLPEGCVFCERCKYAVPECSKNHPGMVTVGGTHQVRCIRYR